MTLTLNIPESLKEQLKQVILQGLRDNSDHHDQEKLNNLIEDVDDYVDILLDDISFSFERLFDDEEDE